MDVLTHMSVTPIDSDKWHSLLLFRVSETVPPVLKKISGHFRICKHLKF